MVAKVSKLGDALFKVGAVLSIFGLWVKNDGLTFLGLAMMVGSFSLLLAGGANP